MDTPMLSIIIPLVLALFPGGGNDDEPAAYYATLPDLYNCPRAQGRMLVDGRINDPDWERAPWSDDFLDIRGLVPMHEGPEPRFKTRMKMLWDDRYLYIAAELQEPDIVATLRMRDTVIFRDNDFEVFIDPDRDNHRYYELEMNAFNTVWDLFLNKPYRDGGKAEDGWNIAGLITAVQINGTINNPRDRDSSWTVEIAIPWKSLDRDAAPLTAPKQGDTWHMNFSRVEWKYSVEKGAYVKVPKTPEDNWVWSAQGVVDMHRPEKWGTVRFVDDPVPMMRANLDFLAFKWAEEHNRGLAPDKQIPWRWLIRFEDTHHNVVMQLFRVYWAQKRYREEHGRWAANLGDLNLLKGISRNIPMQFRTTPQGWECTATTDTEQLTITQDSRLY